LRLQLPAGAVLNVEHDHVILAHGENDSVFVGPLAVEQLTEFLGELVALGRTRAACGMAGQCLHLFEETLVPAFRLGEGQVLGDPGMRFIGVCDGSCRDAPAIGHALIPCLVRACCLNSSRLTVRPACMSWRPWRIPSSTLASSTTCRSFW